MAAPWSLVSLGVGVVSMLGNIGNLMVFGSTEPDCARSLRLQGQRSYAGAFLDFWLIHAPMALLDLVIDMTTNRLSFRKDLHLLVLSQV